MFRGRLDNTAYAYSAIPSSNITLWKFYTGSPIWSSAVISHRVLYFGSNNNKVYALDALTGKHLWNVSTKDDVKATPTIINNRLYVASMDTNLYCLNASTGDLLWNFTTHLPIIASPKYYDNKIYFAAGGVESAANGEMYCVNAVNGTLIWSHPVYNPVWSTAAVVPPFIYFGANDGNLYCLWLSNGTLNWKFKADTSMYGILSSPAYKNGKIIFGVDDGKVYCINATNGSLYWTFSTKASVYSSPAIFKNTVYIGSEDGFLYALPLTDMNDDGIISSEELKWSFDAGAKVESSPVVTNDAVLVGCDSGTFFCINATTGSLIWHFKTGAAIYSSPAVSEGRIYIGSNDGCIYAFGPPYIPKLFIQFSNPTITIQSGSTANITITVTDGYIPIEGAYITLTVSDGTLSANAGTTDQFGMLHITYTAPKVASTTSTILQAIAQKMGFEDGSAFLKIVIQPVTIPAEDAVPAHRYLFLTVVVCILAIVNAILTVLIIRQKFGMRGKK
jgi:outer membrane protein assembly factor BamB